MLLYPPFLLFHYFHQTNPLPTRSHLRCRHVGQSVAAMFPANFMADLCFTAQAAAAVCLKARAYLKPWQAIHKATTLALGALIYALRGVGRDQAMEIGLQAMLLSVRLVGPHGENSRLRPQAAVETAQRLVCLGTK